MDGAADRAQVREPVQMFPAAPPEARDHRVGGRDRDRHREQQRRRADLQVHAGHDLVEGALQARGTVQEEEDREMREDIEERVEAKRATRGDQLVPTRQPAKRRDGQGREEEEEPQDPGRAERVVDRVDAEVVVQRVPREEGRGDCAVDDDEPSRERRVDAGAAAVRRDRARRSVNSLHGDPATHRGSRPALRSR